MSELTPNQTLWFVAKSLQAESDHELHDHLTHECYAGMLVMQELILALYPEMSVPVQRTNQTKEVA